MADDASTKSRAFRRPRPQGAPAAPPLMPAPQAPGGVGQRQRETECETARHVAKNKVGKRDRDKPTTKQPSPGDCGSPGPCGRAVQLRRPDRLGSRLHRSITISRRSSLVTVSAPYVQPMAGSAINPHLNFASLRSSDGLADPLASEGEAVEKQRQSYRSVLHHGFCVQYDEIDRIQDHDRADHS